MAYTQRTMGQSTKKLLFAVLYFTGAAAKIQPDASTEMSNAYYVGSKGGEQTTNIDDTSKRRTRIRRRKGGIAISNRYLKKTKRSSTKSSKKTSKKTASSDHGEDEDDDDDKVMDDDGSGSGSEELENIHFIGSRESPAPSLVTESYAPSFSPSSPPPTVSDAPSAPSVPAAFQAKLVNTGPTKTPSFDRYGIGVRTVTPSILPSKSISETTLPTQFPTESVFPPTSNSMTCRSSLCTIRSIENKDSFCCGIGMHCNRDAILHPFPRKRFLKWDTYVQNNRTMLSLAHALGYTERTWNEPGTNRVEGRSFMDFGEWKVALEYMGFDQFKWDCWVNHYSALSWEELQCYNLDKAYMTLGWNASTWGSAEDNFTPVTEHKKWQNLTSSEKDAAEQLCFFPELWNNIPLEYWQPGWDKKLNTTVSSPLQQVTSGAPLSRPSLQPTQAFQTIRPTAPAESLSSKTPTWDLTVISDAHIPMPFQSPSVCRSSVCSIRTVDNEKSFCCGHYQCEPESFIYPLPYFRFVPWDSAPKVFAELLGYSKQTWDTPGENDFESKSFLKMNDYEKDVLEKLGFDQFTWDCWMTHYHDYSWEELVCYGLVDHFETLGWTNDAWQSADEAKWPIQEFSDWELLFADEKKAAQSLCYFRELWDSESIPDWRSGWDTFFSTQTRTIAPQQIPSRQPIVASSTTIVPTWNPTKATSDRPSRFPTKKPTQTPTASPTLDPTMEPSTSEPTSSPTSSPTMESQRSCRSSICSERTESNEGDLCCGIFQCKAEEAVYPAPYFRYVPWYSAPKALAMRVGYDETTWNLPGENDIEGRSFLKMNDYEKDVLKKMGYSATIWDCWMTHYHDYSWEELVCYGLASYFNTLGWTEDTWQSTDEGDWPVQEFTAWELLYEKERRAAEKLCYFPSLWDGNIIPKWEAGWDASFLTTTAPPTTTPSDEPTKDPTERPTWNPTVPASGSPSSEPSISPTGTPTAMITTSPSAVPTSSPTSVAQRTCRSSVCSIRTTSNDDNFCCGLFTCNSESIIYPAPYFRFIPWDSAQKTLAKRVGYMNETAWNIPGENEIESKSFLKMNDYEKDVLEKLGFDQFKWDCWMTHYLDYSWEELECYGLADHYKTLGWTMDTWQSADEDAWPIQEFSKWEFLYDEERKAAEKLCYFPELWDGDSIAEWGSEWDSYFLSAEPTSSFPPSSFPSSSPSSLLSSHPTGSLQTSSPPSALPPSVAKATSNIFKHGGQRSKESSQNPSASPSPHPSLDWSTMPTETKMDSDLSASPSTTRAAPSTMFQQFSMPPSKQPTQAPSANSKQPSLKPTQAPSANSKQPALSLKRTDDPSFTPSVSIEPSSIHDDDWDDDDAWDDDDEYDDDDNFFLG